MQSTHLEKPRYLNTNLGETMQSTSGIKLIAIVNGVTGFLHGIFWITVFFRLPQLQNIESPEEKLDLVVTYGLGVADMLWCVPLLLASAFLLPKRCLSGWLSAQMANVLWWYSYTFILFREFNLNVLRPGTLIFLPFAIFSFWTAWYLWKHKTAFWESQR